ncbi:hypothetical protein [Cupriavidus sp. AU9028]|uniref:hypothetical protein n=1 Tax=Cupriavidus sp. AU9028 TaxID=2871157 RepID=UPI001C9476E6|nr:hypothetical protein [Cupriavidus sp. AU9028]MBY4898284.1 hypothetical protein [Cupriavidus sp. AU9028]
MAATLLALSAAAHAAPAAPASGATTGSAANGGPSAPAAAKSNGADALAPLLEMLTIGNPLPQLPDCADTRTPDGRDVRAFCVELRGDGVMRQIGVPRDRRPAFMDGPHALALVDRNALVGVIVPTDGLRNENRAMQALTARFGEPFRQERVPMLDRSGNKVETIHAGWKALPLTVELYAIPDDPNTGTIELLLPKARALMAQQDQAVAQQLEPASAAQGKAAPQQKTPQQKAPQQKAPAKPPEPGKPGSW